jgi:iron complex outermembrane receptor protein
VSKNATSVLHWLGLAGVLGLVPCAGAADVLDLPLESLMRLPVSVDSPFQETVFDAAATVAVLRPADWQKRSANTLGQALEQVPAVASYETLGGAHALMVRGYANELSVRGIATQLDGVPLDNYSYATAAYDLPFFPLGLLGSVEMVRGPGSTLYGSDAFHGVLDLHTWLPEDGQRTLALQGGSHQLAGLTGLVANGGPVWSASAGAALSHRGNLDNPYTFTDPASGAQREGERDNNLRDGAGMLHLETGSAQTSLWRISLYGDNYHARGFSGVGTQFYQPLQGSIQSASLNFSGAHDLIGQDSSFAQGQILNQRALGDGLELEVRVFRWQSSQTWILDNQDLPQTLTTAGGTVLPCRTAVAQPGASPLYCPNTLFQSVTNERSGIHVLLKDAVSLDRTQWAVGVGRDWLKVLDATVIRAPFNGAPDYVNAVSPFSGAARHVDYVLAQGRTSLLANRLAAVYGLRWDDYSDVGSSSSPRLGLIWTPRPNWAGKLLYSHAFRAPSAGELYGAGAGSLQKGNPDLKAETLDTLELVLQHQGEGKSTELVLFGNRWNNAIELNPAGLGQNQYQNSGRNRARGVELSRQARLLGWTFEGNVSWVSSLNQDTHAYYTAFPRYIANLGVGHPLPRNWSLWLNERAMLDMTATDMIGSATPVRAPNFYRTDLHLEQQRPHCRLSVDVRNLFDHHNVVPALFNAEGGIPDEPRSLVLGVEVPY